MRYATTMRVLGAIGAGLLAVLFWIKGILVNYDIPAQPDRYTLVTESAPCAGGECAHDYSLPAGFSAVRLRSCDRADASRELTLLESRSMLLSSITFWHITDVVVDEDSQRACYERRQKIEIDAGEHLGIQSVALSAAGDAVVITSRKMNPVYLKHQAQFGELENDKKFYEVILALSFLLLLVIAFSVAFLWSGIFSNDKKVTS